MYETRLSTVLQDTSWFGKVPKVYFRLFFSLVFLFYVLSLILVGYFAAS